ncbi:hypothetical protein [Planotetraspora kaengkrachanensis]|uniref:hypothetical protein n=1 Tax=Planotetraspora kaengkrachanensis TaxID=575193 RepID=UPI0019406E52|nr:hypothetical protein [Planotetraspora kaengkrachanensis]
MTTFDEVSVLWAEHLGAFEPDDLREAEDFGRPFMLLDAHLAGCVTSYVGSRRGVLGADQLQMVSDCARDLRTLLPQLRGREGWSYVARLTRIADLILSDHPGTRPLLEH